MSSILIFGFLLGMRHALEADHIAAVASLTTQSHGLHNTIKQGAIWGMGHTVMLFLFGCIAMLMNSTVHDTLAHWLEFMVGIMLVGLGIDVIRRLMRDRIHYHVHGHGGDVSHFHAHSHRDGSHRKHNPQLHLHDHPQSFPMRALLVGFMHGMAGSAVLIVMTLQNLQSPFAGLVYIFLFGIGSVIGMVALSIIIAMPLQKVRTITWFHTGLQALIGVTTISIGVTIMIGTYASVLA